jgi:hypothetical protein
MSVPFELRSEVRSPHAELDTKNTGLGCKPNGG